MRENKNTVSSAIVKMIDFYSGSLHDINHFLKVYTFAKTIGEEEKLDAKTQMQLEIAAVLHDIACPSLRERFGSADGKLQEKEGTILACEFLKDFNFSKEFKERVIYIVGHHHTYTDVDGIDLQIMLEADFLVNADEGGYTKEGIENMFQNVFKTKTGKELLTSIYRNKLNKTKKAAD